MGGQSGGDGMGGQSGGDGMGLPVWWRLSGWSKYLLLNTRCEIALW